jgi:hypothetical protein
MNYITNYYKNLSEQLQEKVNVLNYKLRQLNEESSTEYEDPAEDSNRIPTSARTASFSGDRAINDNPVTAKPPGSPANPGDLPIGWPRAHQGGPGPIWRKWVNQDGHWHADNPYRYGTPEWYKWEWSWYDVVGNGGAEPGTTKASDKIRQNIPKVKGNTDNPGSSLYRYTKDQLDGVNRFSDLRPPYLASNPKYIEFKKWLLARPGRWHTANPNEYGSDNFYEWELRNIYATP